MSPKVTEGGGDGAANTVEEECAAIPPSALPGISPSGGEIDSWQRLIPKVAALAPQSLVTNTVTIGFLPQASLAVERTARRMASRTMSRSLRRARGMLSTAPSTAS
ncbi:Hypothetical protein NGAL_HAMBI490_25610 [Neorhizobium galegae bv. officinalis]|nr:Hypothetical protein NGAL_HAMBI490_25610 [Neorhizobium galegae bv. officinalis]